MVNLSLFKFSLNLSPLHFVLLHLQIHLSILIFTCFPLFRFSCHAGLGLSYFKMAPPHPWAGGTIHLFLESLCDARYIPTHTHTHTPLQQCVSLITDICRHQSASVRFDKSLLPSVCQWRKYRSSWTQQKRMEPKLLNKYSAGTLV